MYPYLPEFLGLKIPLYGIMTALGYAAAIFYCLKMRRRVNLSKDEVLDIIFYLILGAIAGGKLFFIAFYWQEFASSGLLDKIRFGFVFIGGFLGAAAVALWLFKKKNLNAFNMADFFAPAVSLGHGIGKIGCFLAGCCYGRPTTLPIGVKFTNPQSLVPADLLGAPILPVQLLEAAFGLILFFILYAFYKRKHRAGSVFAVYILIFAAWRFVIEFFRGEPENYILGITATQMTTLILAVLAAAFLIRGGQRERK
jgi:phosphatidylglycerol:prolipoprotein diacylglycerol transferase